MIVLQHLSFLHVLLLILAAAAGDEVVESLTFALVPKQVNNSFFDLADNGCKLRASQLPGVSCLYVGPDDEGDAEAQANILNALLDGDYGPIHGISLSVSDVDVVSPAIARAADMGIPLVTFDSDAKESKRIAYIGTNNNDFGEEMGKLLDQLRPDGGRYGIISSFAPNTVAKEEGVRSRLADTAWREAPTSPKDCLGDIDIFYQQLEEFASDPDVDAILPVGAWGFLTDNITRWTSVKDRYPHIKIVASETLPIALDLMNRGYVDGLVGQLPFNMGELSIQSLWDINQGTEIEEFIWGTSFMEVLLFPLELPEIEGYTNNYIGHLAIFAYVMFGIIALSSLGLLAWTFIKRNTRVIRASQPLFLGMICLGVLIMSASLIPLTIDDDGHDQRATDIACSLLPWCMSIGFTTVFAALFSKTWRVNMIFHNPARFTRMKVTAKDVIWPYAGLMTVNVTALVCWEIINPLVFRRYDHDGSDAWNRPISSYGTCTSSNDVKGGMWPYMSIIVAVNLGVLVLANIQSYQARSIRTEFSESKYISVIMASMLQAFVIAVPIFALVYTLPQVLFVILVSLISVICLAVLILMFVPKIQHLKDWEREQERKRVSKQLRAANNAHPSFPTSEDSNYSQGLKLSVANASSAEPVVFTYTNSDFQSSEVQNSCCDVEGQTLQKRKSAKKVSMSGVNTEDEESFPTTYFDVEDEGGSDDGSNAVEEENLELRMSEQKLLEEEGAPDLTVNRFASTNSFQSTQSYGDEEKGHDGAAGLQFRILEQTKHIESLEKQIQLLLLLGHGQEQQRSIQPLESNKLVNGNEERLYFSNAQSLESNKVANGTEEYFYFL